MTAGTPTLITFYMSGLVFEEWELRLSLRFGHGRTQEFIEGSGGETEHAW